MGELADLRQRAPVLLALADACSREDGTGCWPSAAAIARKANVSDRTVRRVIARLEAEGHVLVHRGGGRAGSTNSYTTAVGRAIAAERRLAGFQGLRTATRHRSAAYPTSAHGRSSFTDPWAAG